MDHPLCICDSFVVVCDRSNLKLQPVERCSNRVEALLPSPKATIGLSLTEQGQRLSMAIAQMFGLAESPPRGQQSEIGAAFLQLLQSHSQSITVGLNDITHIQQTGQR